MLMIKARFIGSIPVLFSILLSLAPSPKIPNDGSLPEGAIMRLGKGEIFPDSIFAGWEPAGGREQYWNMALRWARRH